MKKFIFISSMLLSSTSQAVSFDCEKATTFIENAICTDSLLGQLDDALNDNYKQMRDADIGEGAKKDLKNSQKKWLSKRDECTNNKCVENSYRQRIDEICEYPVISGVHPGCITSDSIKKTSTPSLDFTGWWGINSDGCFDEDNKYRVALGKWTRKNGDVKFGIGEEALGMYDGGCKLSREKATEDTIIYKADCTSEGEDIKGKGKIVLENDFSARIFMPILSDDGLLVVRCKTSS